MCTHKLAEKNIYLARVLSRALINKLATDKIGLFICCKANETSLSDGQTITSNIKSFFPVFQFPFYAYCAIFIQLLSNFFFSLLIHGYIILLSYTINTIFD